MANPTRDEQELEVLQAKHVGTGSADTTSHEFLCNMHRDTLNSIIGHPSLLQYTSIGLGKSKEQTRVQMLERMIRPIKPEASSSSGSKTKQRLRKEHKKQRETMEEKELGENIKKEREEEEEEQKKREAFEAIEAEYLPGPTVSKGPADEFGFGPDGKRARF